MAFEQRDGSGALFKNDKKGNDKAPDYRGDANVNGELVEIAAWLKESANGKKFMSLSFKPKEFTGGAAKVSKAEEFDDSDIPF